MVFSFNQGKLKLHIFFSLVPLSNMSPILFQTQSLVLFFIFLQKLWIIYATYVSSEKGQTMKKEQKIKKGTVKFYFEINSYSVQIDHFVNFSEGRFNLVLGFVPGILI